MDPYAAPQSDFAVPVVPVAPSFLDRPLPITGVVLFADAVLTMAWALVANAPIEMVRALFDMIFGVGLIRSNERYRNWSMIRAGLWVMYALERLPKGKPIEGLIDMGFALLFLAPMLGLLVGAPSRTRVIASIVAFGVYALAMLGVIAIVALGKLLGSG